MNNLPFETIGLVADDVKALEDTYEALKKRFGADLPCDVELKTNKFDFFNNNASVS